MEGPIVNNPEAIHLIQWGFYALLTGCAVIIANTLISVKNSIVELNSNMARVVERQEWHGREIERVDLRVERLETKVN